MTSTRPERWPTRARPRSRSPMPGTAQTSRSWRPAMSPASPVVGILVGSESDRERMQEAVDELATRGIAAEFEGRSAHRDPLAVAEYAAKARVRGLKVLSSVARPAAAPP